VIYNAIGTFAYPEVAQYMLNLPTGKSLLLLTLMSLTFLVKAGVFPVHVWVNDAHSTAPNEFSPFLSGLMLKVGAYGMLLILYLMPVLKIFSGGASYRGLSLFNYILALFGALTTVSGTILAIRQEDVKRLIAFSSISQMGYVMMGLAIATPLGVTGGLLHIMNHLIFKSAIFLTIAAVYYRTHTTTMHEMGGLIFRMPVTFATFLTAIIALAGIPPTNGFISKWVIYQSLFEKGYLFLALAAFFGSIGSFMYVFKPLSTIFLGQLKPQHENIREVPWLMQIPMFILMGLMLLFGIFPGIQMNIISDISSYLNIQAVSYSLFTIDGAFGSWQSLVIFNVFSAGFLLSLLLFLLGRKSKLVGLLDTYTAGEYMNDAEAYHFAYQYYRPFDRLFDDFAAGAIFFCVKI
ncbi:MAG: proton-conducting transporter membrane subunit, partial [Halanaerobiaceae bacterium]